MLILALKGAEFFGMNNVRLVTGAPGLIEFSVATVYQQHGTAVHRTDNQQSETIFGDHLPRMFGEIARPAQTHPSRLNTAADL